MMYKHTKNDQVVTVIEAKENSVLVRMEDGSEKEISENTLKRWYAPIEAPVDEVETTEAPTVEAEVIEANEVAAETLAAEEAPLMEMSKVVEKLEALFDLLNKVYFDGILPRPVITVQSTPKAYGHCSTKKIWTSENDARYEINIGAEFLNRPSENTAATMCHEMVHLYCLEQGIADTCQHGRYHNKTFKEEAEARDLHIEYDRTNGYSTTTPTEAFMKTLTDNDFILEVPFARVMPQAKAKRERKTQFKYVCPICGQTVKSTSELNLICGDCEVPMEIIG